MKAIILAAGFATRLYPLTIDIPKSLLKVKNRLIIDWIMNKLVYLPLSQIIVITNHKFYNKFLEWSQNKEVTIIDDGVNSEDEKRGAITDLYLAINKERINEDIIVISGDNLFEFSLLEPYNYFKKENKDLAIFYDIKDINEAKRFGIGIVKDNILIDFQEKPTEPKSTLCSTSIYFYKKETIHHIKQFAQTNSDQPGLFLHYLYKKKPILAFVTKERWIDIGTKESLSIAENEF
jgi:glucose-1-phosphate thymidylyltransferase